MNRRALLLASVAALPAATSVAPIAAQRQRATRRRRASGTTPAARRRRGGLTASHVRSRIVTRTFASTAPIDIPTEFFSPRAADPYPSTIQVRGFHRGRVLKVRVSLLGLSHTTAGNLDIMLVAPGNLGVIIMSDAGGVSNVTDITLVFDQDAPNVLPEQLVSGVFQPSNFSTAADEFPPPAPQGVTGHSLTRFNNRNPNGTWKLFILNEAHLATGTLDRWSLTIRAKVRMPHRHPSPRDQRSTRRAKT